ncbi:MAG TPA: hypothetical protein PKM62_03660, partial [Azospira sp.]|nr:hypothetical protein [Azospira sp.]
MIQSFAMIKWVDQSTACQRFLAADPDPVDAECTSGEIPAAAGYRFGKRRQSNQPRAALRRRATVPMSPRPAS